MQKLNPIDTARIQILHSTGAITCRDLSKIFKVNESRISQITRGYRPVYKKSKGSRAFP